MNDLVFDIAVEYETLRSDPVRSVSQEARFQILQKQLEIAKTDKKFLLNCLGVIIGISALMMGYGFIKWHTVIQPLQDEITRLNIKKLKREVGEEDNA